MHRMASDSVPALMAAASGELAGVKLEWRSGPSVCVVLASGERVLGVTAAGQDLPGAIDGAYQAVRRIAFDGMHYREDIGRKGMMWPIGGFQCEYRQLL